MLLVRSNPVQKFHVVCGVKLGEFNGICLVRALYGQQINLSLKFQESVELG